MLCSPERDGFGHCLIRPLDGAVVGTGGRGDAAAWHAGQPGSWRGARSDVNSRSVGDAELDKDGAHLPFTAAL